VLVPNIGSVPAAGRTLAEFRKALRSATARRYRDFELYCYLAQPRLFRVYVTGEVVKPGVVAARAYERVSDVVERAGGLSDRASRRDIELRDLQGELQSRVDLAAFEAHGDLNANPLLSGGQMVWVPVRRRSVQLLGEVGMPGTYETRRGESLSDLLRLAGGPTPRADLEHVSVESMDSTGTVRVRNVDLRQDPTVADDDVVRVSVLSSTLGRNRVFVIMPSGEERTLFLSEGETLRDLLPRVSQLQPEADLTQAELATQDEKGGRVQVPVDVERVLAGDDNRPLRDGDILSIPRVKNYVYVSGYVTEPGAYSYRSDWTVNDYLGEAGGPTAGGSLGRVKIVGSDGTRRGGDRETRLQRGDTIFVDRSFFGKASGALGLVANLSALVISIVALRR
jgi:protein involved in polysaccharide export with SLBB domain